MGEVLRGGDVLGENQIAVFTDRMRFYGAGFSDGAGLCRMF